MRMDKPLSFPDIVRVSARDAAPFEAEPGLERRVLAHNQRMMLVEHHMAVGWAGARHSHPHDQLVYVVAGRIRFSCGPETFEMSPGDSALLRGGIEHQAWALEPSIVLDVFTPYREEYVDRPQ
jgi:quercetin dioxygenase-like cupin family protein